MDQQIVIKRTRSWISSLVIGLNLCPFAQRVFEGNKIKYVVSETSEEDVLLTELARELNALASVPVTAVETTLLIHPQVLTNFPDYNDFLGLAENLLADLRLSGIIQIASFHPDYQFAATPADAVENYTNRSPFPMLHLLREKSISEVAGDPDVLLEIPRRNIATLRRQGRKKILEKLKAIEDDLK
ncbi:MAG: DUF1415 domain-containing protein [Gemmataceae bacterium]